MIERRQRNRRSGDSGTGRRSTDCRPMPLSFRKASAGEIPQQLVVVGSRGVAGAKMARFLKLWAGEHVQVTLVEPGFAAGAMSAVGGDGHGDGFTEYFPYDRRGLSSRYGIHVVGAKVSCIDATRRALTLADGTRLAFDRLELAPGTQLPVVP
jgi:sulfide dehydrogenase [flavocytochrome c] flavoprotein chain